MWLQSVRESDIEEGGISPTWGSDFLVGTVRARIWFRRFLVAIKPRLTMQDQVHSETSDSDRGGIEARGGWGSGLGLLGVSLFLHLGVSVVQFF